MHGRIFLLLVAISFSYSLAYSQNIGLCKEIGPNGEKWCNGNSQNAAQGSGSRVNYQVVDLWQSASSSHDPHAPRMAGNSGGPPKTSVEQARRSASQATQEYKGLEEIRKYYQEAPSKTGLSEQEWAAREQSENLRHQKELNYIERSLSKKVEQSYAGLLEKIPQFQEKVKIFLEQREKFDKERKKWESSEQSILAEAERKRLEKQRIKQGGYKDDHMARVHQSLDDAVYRMTDLNTAMLHIDSTQNWYYDEKKAIGREQLRPIVEQYIDERGLVKAWQDTAPWVKERDLQSSLNDEFGRRIRSTINQGLGSLKLNSGNTDTKEKAEYLLETLFDADRLSSQTDTQFRAQRLLKRAEKIYQYLNPDDYAYLNKRAALSETAVSAFGISGVDANTFTGREIITVANEAANSNAITNDDILRFHISTALQQAKTDSARGDWRNALKNVDRAWNVVDYSKGLVKGLYEFGADTISGLANLAMHPIDSAEALYESIVNYDQTYDLIRSSLDKIWNEYDTYSAEEKGNLDAKIASSLVTSLLPFGAIKNLGAVRGLPNLLETLIAKTIQKAPKIAVSDWPELSGMLRSATIGKGNFGIGSASLEQANSMGLAWVGDGYRTTEAGKILISKDSLRQYRMPSEKPNSMHARTGIQANFEGRVKPVGEWQTNAHLDILE